MWSWNVRGLGDYTSADCKARNVFLFFSDHTEWDVVMLQEHKLDEEKIADVERIFLREGRTWWCPSSGTKGGVSITVA